MRLRRQRDVDGLNFVERAAIGGEYQCFFFQAEDGIRALYVTGVQTCALPIYLRMRGDEAERARLLEAEARIVRGNALNRSEERRVGKECRYRWSPDH